MNGRKIILIGVGNVGGQVLEQLALNYYSGPLVIADSQDMVSLPEPTQENLVELLKVRRNGHRFDSLSQLFEVHDVSELFNHVKEGDIVVNCMPSVFPDQETETVQGAGIPQSVELDAMALGKGAHVVAAHKSSFGDSQLYNLVMKASRESGAKYVPSGALMGPTRAIEIVQCLVDNNIGILSARGAVNGTTVYMLDRMVKDGLSYGDVLAEAQEKGYAEPDPSADVKGHDALAKMQALAIMAGNFAGSELSGVKGTNGFPDNAGKGKGITGVNGEVLEYVKSKGLSLALVGSYDSKTGIVRIGPEALEPEDPLYGLKGTTNRLILTLTKEIDMIGMLDDVYGQATHHRNGEHSVRVEHLIRPENPLGQHPKNRGHYNVHFKYHPELKRLEITGPGAGNVQTAVALLNAVYSIMRPPVEQKLAVKPVQAQRV